MNKQEREENEQMAELGCIVCRLYGPISSGGAEIHHLRTGAGIGRRNKKRIPLCPEHHRYGGYGVAYHMGAKKFQENYGSEEELWQQTQALLRSN